MCHIGPYTTQSSESPLKKKMSCPNNSMKYRWKYVGQTLSCRRQILICCNSCIRRLGFLRHLLPTRVLKENAEWNRWRNSSGFIPVAAGRSGESGSVFLHAGWEWQQTRSPADRSGVPGTEKESQRDTHTHMHTHTCTLTLTCTHTHMRTNPHKHTHTHSCSTHTHAHTLSHTQSHTYSHTHRHTERKEIYI